MPLTKDETKAAMKEAIKEWLDERFIMFGKWSLITFATCIFAAFIYFVAWMSGWHSPTTP